MRKIIFTKRCLYYTEKYNNIENLYFKRELTKETYVLYDIMKGSIIFSVFIYFALPPFFKLFKDLFTM